jgi:hypothetical protein
MSIEPVCIAVNINPIDRHERSVTTGHLVAVLISGSTDFLYFIAEAQELLFWSWYFFMEHNLHLLSGAFLYLPREKSSPTVIISHLMQSQNRILDWDLDTQHELLLGWVLSGEREHFFFTFLLWSRWCYVIIITSAESHESWACICKQRKIWQFIYN